MTSFIRSTVVVGTALLVTVAASAGIATSAEAATPATAATVTTATPNPTQTADAPEASATDTPSAPAKSTPSPSATSPVDVDPSLSAMNAAGNHTMGSTIPATDSAAGSTSLAKMRSLAKVQASVQAAAGPAGLPGLDVSAYQPSINWTTVAKNGAKFAYVKATEGTTYSSATFSSQYNGSYSAGLTRGAYHFATPNTSSGAAQATYFVNHGGGWSPDGRTLPPLLDIEYGYNATCWGLSQSAMVSWISSFSSTVLSMTGIRPAIYSTTDWWKTCTGNSAAFSANPLFVAHYTTASTPGTLPAGWKSWSIWQWADAGVFPGDQDVFNGTTAGLQALTLGSTAKAIPYTAPTAASTLATGAKLLPGKTITSSNGQHRLTMQTDGNLVELGNGHVEWNSHTDKHPNSYLIMQTDGNLVVYSPDNKPLWYTATQGGADGKLIVQSNGDLQVSTSQGLVWRNKAPGSATLTQGTTLTGGQLLHDSTGFIQAIMQTDGNFVVYVNGKARWNARTQGNAGARLILQTDGNLVVYSKSNKALWNSHTFSSGEKLIMQGDGNLVLYAGTKAKWQSHT